MTRLAPYKIKGIGNEILLDPPKLGMLTSAVQWFTPRTRHRTSLSIATSHPLDEGLGLVLIPSDDLFLLLLDSETGLASDGNAEGSIRVAFSVVDDILQKAARLGEEDFAAF